MHRRRPEAPSVVPRRSASATIVANTDGTATRSEIPPSSSSSTTRAGLNLSIVMTRPPPSMGATPDTTRPNRCAKGSTASAVTSRFIRAASTVARAFESRLACVRIAPSGVPRIQRCTRWPLPHAKRARRLRCPALGPNASPDRYNEPYHPRPRGPISACRRGARGRCGREAANELCRREYGAHIRIGDLVGRLDA